MKSASRSAIFFLLIPVLLLGILTGCARPERTNYPDTLEDAAALEAKKPKQALEEFTAIKDKYDRTEPEKAAQALWLAANFASDPGKYGTPEQVDAGPVITPEVHKQLDDMQAEGKQLAHESLKQLQQSYPESSYAPKARTMMVDIEQQMDAHNRNSPNYKIIDVLVAATGKKSGFSYWFALAIIAIVVKTVTLPLTLKMYKSQREMQRLQPAIKELQKKHKDKPAELQQATMAFYKEHGVSPFASCLPMMIQLPFMWWIYAAIREYQYHFANGTFLWVGSSLSRQYPAYIGASLARFDVPLLVLYAASNFITMRLTPSPDPAQAAQQKQMSVMMTGVMFWIFMKNQWPSAFIFYWLVLNIFSAVQQYHYVYKPNKARVMGADGVIVLPSTLVTETGGKSGGINNGVRGLSQPPRTADSPPAGSTTRPRPKRKNRR